MRPTQTVLLLSLFILCCFTSCSEESPTQSQAAGARAYFTTDGGATWEFDTTSIEGVFYATSSIADGEINVVGGTKNLDGVILHLAREDDAWHVDTIISGGIGGSVLYDITTNLPRNSGGIGPVGFVAGGGKILRTTDGGEHWNNSSVPTLSNPRYISFATPEIGMAAAGTQMLRTTNRGISWSAIPTPSSPQQFAATQVTPVNESIWIASGSNSEGVIRSTDGGLNWSLLNVRGTPNDDKYNFTAASPDGHVIAVSNTAIYGSNDSGATWSRSFTVTAGEKFTSLYYGFNAAYVSVYNTNQTRLILRSADGGETWGTAGPLITDGVINGIYFFDGNIGNAVGD